MHNGVGKLYFSGLCLIPDRIGDIIDRLLLIGPINDVSSVEKTMFC